MSWTYVPVMRFTHKHLIKCVYLSGVTVTQVEWRHEVGVILLHTGGPLRQLGNLEMMETDLVSSQLKTSPCK